MAVKRQAGGITNVEMDGMMETIQSVRGIADALERKETNKELRQAARSCATRLAADLVRAADASGVPVAPRVAKSVRVKGDRVPVVSIGGPKRVGTGKGHRASAAAILWGSEQGPKSEPNHFAVAPNPAGYWIAPTVERFGNSDALPIFQRAVYEILHEHGLV